MKVELNKVYKDRQGNQWKVFCITSEDVRRWKVVCATDQTQTRLNRYTREGRDCDGEPHPTDLIELVGGDFKREPVKITFTASVDSCSSDREKGIEVVTLSTHKHTTHDFEVWEALNKMGYGAKTCKVTIEEIEE